MSESLFWHLPSCVSTHSRPKAAGSQNLLITAIGKVSTHSRPKAAGDETLLARVKDFLVSTHSRPKAAGKLGYKETGLVEFQHTAARRRLDPTAKSGQITNCFNTQPPEGGWR